MAGTGWTTADNWAGRRGKSLGLVAGNNVDNATQPDLGLPPAPDLGSFDPNALSDAYRNTMFDVWKPTNGVLVPKGARLSLDGKQWLDPVASQNEQIAAQQATRKTTERLLFESMTGYSDPKAQKAAKWSNMAGNVFDGFVAPMASMFGPRGASEGVSEYLKSAKEDAKRQQAAVDNRRQMATNNLKTIMSGYGNASPFTQKNFDNILDMFKAKASMQEAQARAYQAMQAAKENQAQTGEASARQKAIEEGVKRDNLKGEVDRRNTESQIAARKPLQDYREKQGKLADARYSLLQNQILNEGKRGALLNQNIKTNEAMMRNYNNLIHNRDLSAEDKKNLIPVNDAASFYKQLPPQFAHAEGQALAEKYAAVLSRKLQIPMKEAYSRTLGALKAQAWQAAQAAKMAKESGGLELGGVEDDNSGMMTDEQN